MARVGETWMNTNSRSSVFVQCAIIDEDNRIACAMHTGIPGEAAEPYLLMVPVNPLAAGDIESVTIRYSDGKERSVPIDKHSQSFLR